MQPGDDQQRLLAEIRDILREHLEEYRRVTARSLEYQQRVTEKSLELQQRAVLRQEQLGRLYKFALVAVALLVVAAVWFLSQLPIWR